MIQRNILILASFLLGFAASDLSPILSEEKKKTTILI